MQDKNPIAIEELDQMIKHYNAFMAGGAYHYKGRYVPKIIIDSAMNAAHSLKSEILKIAGFLVLDDSNGLLV